MVAKVAGVTHITRRTAMIAAAIVATLVIIIVGVYWYERPLLLTGTGYAAHNACAVTQIAGRDHPEVDLPPNPLVGHLRTSSDADSTRATIRGLLAGQTAWFTPGYGCTVSRERPDLPPPYPVDGSTNPFADLALVTPPDELAGLIGRAFGDDLSAEERDALGTRAIVVVSDGEIVAERYADGFSIDTPQLGWSMAKSVANLITGRLVNEGLISTDDPIWPDKRGERATITIDHLMRMTSGLAWDETYDLGTPITAMLYLKSDMAAFVTDQPLAYAVGSYQQYSSGSTNLLCSILIERVGGDASLPYRTIFEPLGLSSAVLEPDGAGNPVCSSYMWATPRDWATIGQFVLDNGEWNGRQLLPDDWMSISTTVIPTEDGQEDGYAAGWWVNQRPDGSLVDPALPADTYWAAGHDGQYLYVVPSADLVVVRLGFTPEADDNRVAALVADLAKLD